MHVPKNASTASDDNQIYTSIYISLNAAELFHMNGTIEPYNSTLQYEQYMVFYSLKLLVNLQW